MTNEIRHTRLVLKHTTLLPDMHRKSTLSQEASSQVTSNACVMRLIFLLGAHTHIRKSRLHMLAANKRPAMPMNHDQVLAMAACYGGPGNSNLET